MNDNASKKHIITAANKKYFKNLQQLIYTYFRASEQRNSKLVIYDLGLAKEQVAELQALVAQHPSEIQLKIFPFEEYPDFVRPEHNTYSWKPIIAQMATEEFGGCLLWMDSANCILRDLTPVWQEIQETQTYAPLSGSGLLKEWTVQQTLDYMNVPESYYKKRNRAGNTFGFDTDSETVRKLISRWKDLALVKECIRPEGANRSNHRDDQSVLTILLLEQEEKGNLTLSKEEVNISSGRPSKYISVRNIFPKFPTLAAGSLAHYYFLIHRRIDIIINSIWQS